MCLLFTSTSLFILPPNVHRLAVLVEFGLPNSRVAHRLKSTRRSPSQSAASRTVRTTHSNFLNRLNSFGSCLKQAEARFNFDHSKQILAFKRSLRSRSLSMQIDQLRKCEYSRILRNVSIQPSPCIYIKLDQRPIAILRARLRLNRNHLNYTKFRCKMSLCPLCPSCPHSAETVRHVLFDCPTFAAVTSASIPSKPLSVPSHSRY